jgi:hypothetical protein
VFEDKAYADEAVAAVEKTLAGHHHDDAPGVHNEKAGVEEVGPVVGTKHVL